MRLLPLLVLVATVSLSNSCKSKDDKAAPNNAPAVGGVLGASETITGKVEVSSSGGESIVTVTVNPESKSRVSYTVLGDQAAALEAKKGETVTVTGNVTSASPFSKTIQVTDIK